MGVLLHSTMRLLAIFCAIVVISAAVPNESNELGTSSGQGLGTKVCGAAAKKMSECARESSLWADFVQSLSSKGNKGKGKSMAGSLKRPANAKKDDRKRKGKKGLTGKNNEYQDVVITGKYVGKKAHMFFKSAHMSAMEQARKIAFIAPLEDGLFKDYFTPPSKSNKFKVGYSGKKFKKKRQCANFYLQKIKEMGACGRLGASPKRYNNIGCTGKSGKKKFDDVCGSGKAPCSEAYREIGRKGNTTIAKIMMLKLPSPCFGTINFKPECNFNYHITRIKKNTATLLKKMKKWRHKPSAVAKLKAKLERQKTMEKKCAGTLPTLIYTKEVPNPQGGKLQQLTLVVNGKTIHGDTCSAEYGVTYAMCKTCCCKHGLVQYATTSKNLSKPGSDCKDWYAAVGYMGGVFFGAWRTARIKIKTKACQKTRCGN